MKFFIKKFGLFSVIIISILFCGPFLPPTPRASKSALFAQIQKDSLLKHVKSPRIIFVGGSNIGFGLNSYKIKEQLGLNPVNTGIDGNVGLKYMLDNTIGFVRHGDIIILAPEYLHFYRPYEFSSGVLLRTILDIFPEKTDLLSVKQKVNLFKGIPKFSITKLKPTEYWGYQIDELYSTTSFNEFGDKKAHWQSEEITYQPSVIKGELFHNVFKKIKEFEQLVIAKGAKVYITFPTIDEVTFTKSKEKILAFNGLYESYNFNVLGTAERYVFPKEMMFNSIYHVNRKGLELRTKLLIEDYLNYQKLP